MTQKLKQPSADNIKLQLLDWQQAKSVAKMIRRTVFIVEQQVPESEEWDNEDNTALHVLAFLKGKPVGTARLTKAGKIGRMAVLKAYRNQGIASLMLSKLINVAKLQGLTTIALHAQTHAQRFYAKRGFVADDDTFLEAGIEHIKMQLFIN